MADDPFSSLQLAVVRRAVGVCRVTICLQLEELATICFGWLKMVYVAFSNLYRAIPFFFIQSEKYCFLRSVNAYVDPDLNVKILPRSYFFTNILVVHAPLEIC